MSSTRLQSGFLGLAAALCIGASLLVAMSISGCAWTREKQAEDAEAAAQRSQESAARAEEAADKALESSAAAMKAADHAAAAVKEATKEMDRVSAYLEELEKQREADEAEDDEDAPAPHHKARPATVAKTSEEKSARADKVDHSASTASSSPAANPSPAR